MFFKVTIVTKLLIKTGKKICECSLLLYCISMSFLHSEKADLRPRNENNIGVPHLDDIYTTDFTPYHPQQGFHHHGSPEALKVRMTAMVLSPPTRV